MSVVIPHFGTMTGAEGSAKPPHSAIMEQPDGEAKLKVVKRQAERLKDSRKAQIRGAERGTLQLQAMKIRKTNQRSVCSYICGGSPFKDKLHAFFISHFDASIVILPFLFKRAGWLTCSGMLCFLAAWSYYTSILMYECIRLLLGNHRMR